jgi:hypothetical protein
LGVDDLILVPWPAARMTAAVARLFMALVTSARSGDVKKRLLAVAG